MQKHAARNTVLALTGVLALTIYILACTSFSPDDTKVLYPAFDGPSGRLGIAVYDREAKRSDMLFVPVGEKPQDETLYMRAQWLGDGQRVLVYWGEADHLSLAVMSSSRRPAVRLFALDRLKEDPNRFTMPLPVVGDRVFLIGSSNELMRLDLKTGAVETKRPDASGRELLLCGLPGGKKVLWFEQAQKGATLSAAGLLDPNTFSQSLLTTFTNELEMMDGSFFAYDATGRRLAMVQDAHSPRVVIMQDGQQVFTHPLNLPDGDTVRFGNAVFSPKGDKLVAAFQRERSSSGLSGFGIMEIPLQNQPVRETLLVRDLKARDLAALFFQVGLAHDGKTAAIASTHLACAAEGFKPQDCALFLVDLTHPQRKVTKIPIPLPADVPRA